MSRDWFALLYLLPLIILAAAAVRDRRRVLGWRRADRYAMTSIECNERTWRRLKRLHDKEGPAACADRLASMKADGFPVSQHMINKLREEKGA